MSFFQNFVQFLPFCPSDSETDVAFYLSVCGQAVQTDDRAGGERRQPSPQLLLLHQDRHGPKCDQIKSILDSCHKYIYSSTFGKSGRVRFRLDGNVSGHRPPHQHCRYHTELQKQNSATKPQLESSRSSWSSGSKLPCCTRPRKDPLITTGDGADGCSTVSSDSRCFVLIVCPCPSWRTLSGSPLSHSIVQKMAVSSLQMK